MSNNLYIDAATKPPTFDEMVSLIEKNFRDSLLSSKAFTDAEIEESWQRYKALNHLHPSESAGVTAVWVKADTKPPFNECVLVFIPDEDNHITAGMWDVSMKWVLLDEYRTPECEVTHWMELPPIPAEYEREELPQGIVEALQEIAEKELPKELKMDSIFMIGRVKDRFKELAHKQWDWRSFYNGWLEGRADMYPHVKPPTAAQGKDVLRETIEDVLLKTGRHNQEECTGLADAILQDISSGAQSGKEDAVAQDFAEWMDKHFAGWYENGELKYWFAYTLNGQEGQYTTTQLYDIYIKQKEEQQ